MTSEEQRYRCPYCGKWFVVAVMNDHHQANNQCGLVPQEQK